MQNCASSNLAAFVFGLCRGRLDWNVIKIDLCSHEVRWLQCFISIISGEIWLRMLRDHAGPSLYKLWIYSRLWNVQFPIKMNGWPMLVIFFFFFRDNKASRGL